jgi:hypothetical protein
MRTVRVLSSYAALPCQPVNVPAAVRNCRRTPSFVARMAKPSSNERILSYGHFIFKEQ